MLSDLSSIHCISCKLEVGFQGLIGLLTLLSRKLHRWHCVLHVSSYPEVHNVRRPLLVKLCLITGLEVMTIRSHHCRSKFFLCACMHTQSCPILCDPRDCSPLLLHPWSSLSMDRFLCPWDFPGKNTGVGCHFLLQEIFQTSGSNPHLLRFLHWQVDFLPLSPLGSLFPL